MFVTHLLSVLVILALVWTAAFYQLSRLVWTSLIGVALIVITLYSLLAPIPLLAFWVIFLVAAGFANLTRLRREYIIAPMVSKLQKQMPPISDTERAAIEAGDTWWEKELFCGNPDWSKLFSMPRPALSKEEQSFMDNQVNHLCEMINDFNVVHKDHDLSPEAWEYLKKEKFFGLVIPRQYGGLGFSALAHSTMVTALGSHSITTAVTAMVPNSLGPGELLLHYGTEEQKNYYLPRLASGEEIPCFALTGPDAGSDAGAIPDKGIVCRGTHEGKQIIGISLTWDKRYITLAPVATVLGLAVRLYDPDHLIGEKEDIGITLCLIPVSHPGVEIGNRHLPMAMAFQNGPTRGKDVFIPLDWIVGGVKMAGQGWRMLMESLSIGRSISLPALSSGCIKLAYRQTGAYSRVRRQFNAPLSAFEGIEESLGYIAGYAYMVEACRLMTAGAIDMDINPSIVSAITKYQLTEMCRAVINHGMDVQGGHGIQMGPRNTLAPLYLAVPISITVEGANILTRNLIIFGQGAIRCHPYILKEVELLSSPEPEVAQLDKTLVSHVGFYVSNFLRSLAYGLTGGLLIRAKVKNKRIARYQRQLTRMSTALALMADTSLILLGGSLKRRERISARLGDILSQLYVASTVLKYYKDNNEQPVDVPSVCWALRHCLYKIQIASDELANNFPYKWLSKFIHIIIFPFGPAYAHPGDKLHKSVLDAMLTPGELRTRLIRYSYVSKDDSDVDNMLEQAFKQVDQIDPIWKKVQKAVQNKSIPAYYDFETRVQTAREKEIISADEAQKLSDYEKIRTEIIKVNEFSFDFNEVIA